MKLFDRLSSGFGKIGTAANQALDETKLQLEIMRARRRKDGLARDLGYLVFRVAQGAAATAGEQDALIAKITEVEKEIDRLEAEAKAVRELGRIKPAGAAPEPPPAAETPEPPAATEPPPS